MTCRGARVAALAVLVLLGATVPTAQAARTKPPRRPHVVVAVADTGVNPYHEAYYRPQNTAHPCTWVVGFTDCSIPALPLSVGRYKSYAKAVEADAEIWEWVEPHQWYWIPRTNIIGAVCDTSRGGTAVSPDATCILDDDGHGTGTSSSVLSEAPDSLLLIHDGKSNAANMVTAPVVPDIQSHSWGPAAPLVLHAAGALPGESQLCRPIHRPETVFFLAAGNEVPWPTWTDCDRQHADVQVVGGSYPGHWDYDSWTMYDFASWMCRPVALRDAIQGERRACGTSFAAPTAAGAAAAALLRIRRHDRFVGRSTRTQVSRTVAREDFIQALRNGASYDPKPKYATPPQCAAVLCYFGWAPMPQQAAHVFWGYGWLDSTVADAVVSCALGRACPAKSAEATTYNEQRQALRRLVGSDAVPPSPQDDAGSSRDAGSDQRTAVRVTDAAEYSGQLETYGVEGDLQDWYSFRALKGQRISVATAAYVDPTSRADAAGVAGCWNVVDPTGKRLTGEGKGASMYTAGCDSAAVNAPPQDVLAHRTGIYYLVYSSHNGGPSHRYEFSLSLAR